MFIYYGLYDIFRIMDHSDEIVHSFSMVSQDIQFVRSVILNIVNIEQLMQNNMM